MIARGRAPCTLSGLLACAARGLSPASLLAGRNAALSRTMSWPTFGLAMLPTMMGGAE
jgi:hypothetical protein